MPSPRLSVPLSVAALSALTELEFIAVLKDVFEHSPWVAAGAYHERPFGTLDELHRAMCAVVEAADTNAQLGLIRAHPDLAGKAALAGELTEASSLEQAGAGLDRLTEAEYRRFHALNDAYQAHFGFPFILAVKGHTKTSILAAFEIRLPNSPEAERKAALTQIYQIARFRLAALLGVL